MNDERPTVKGCPGNDTPNDPTVFVVSGGNQPVIGVTTTEHMRVADIPLEEYLKKVVQEARVFGDKLFGDYGEGKKNGWFPCGTANLVLRWNGHREIIDIMRKTSTEGKKGKSDFWKGWFGRLYKTGSHGWWWTPPMQGTQCMLFQEEVCKFVRDKLVFKDVKVDVRTYID